MSSDTSRFSHALITYTASEQITSDVVETAYWNRTSRGRRGRNFNIFEMHTRTVDGTHYLAMRFAPTQSRASFRAIFDRIETSANLNVALVRIAGSDREIHMGAAELNSASGGAIRTIIRDHGPPMRHSFFSHGIVSINHPFSILRLGDIGNNRRGRRRAAAVVEVPDGEAEVSEEELSVRYQDEGSQHMEVDPLGHEVMAPLLFAAAVEAPAPAPVIEAPAPAVEAPVAEVEAPAPEPAVDAPMDDIPAPPRTPSSESSSSSDESISFSPVGSSSSSSSPSPSPLALRIRSPPPMTPHQYLIDRIIRLENAVRALGGNV